MRYWEKIEDRSSQVAQAEVDHLRRRSELAGFLTGEGCVSQDLLASDLSRNSTSALTFGEALSREGYNA